jgi:hypothetical protein
MKHIPKSVRHKWSADARKLAASLFHQMDEIHLWKLLFMYAACTLQSAPRGNVSQVASIRARVKQWKNSEAAALWKEATSGPTRGAPTARPQVMSAEKLEEKNGRRARTLIQEGQFSRAAKALVSNRIAKNTPCKRSIPPLWTTGLSESFQLIKALTPASSPWIRSQRQLSPFTQVPPLDLPDFAPSTSKWSSTPARPLPSLRQPTGSGTLLIPWLGVKLQMRLLLPLQCHYLRGQQEGWGSQTNCSGSGHQKTRRQVLCCIDIQTSSRASLASSGWCGD